VRVLVRRWLWGLNVAVLAAGLTLGLAGARRGFFLAALVPLALAPFSYARLRLQDTLARTFGAAAFARVFAAAGIVCDVVLIAQLVTTRSAGAWPMLHGPSVDWLGPVWFSAHAILFVGYLLLGLGRALHRLLDRSWARATGRVGAPLVGPASPGRRDFLRQMSVGAVALPFAASVSGVSTSYDFRVEEREIVLPGWPRELDGLRVVHLSDIHVGGGMNRERLLRVAELTSRARPDLVAHTGDFLTHRSGDFDTPLYEALSRVRAPLGQWACLGNHDYDDPALLTRRLHDAGVVVLRNRLTRIDVGGTPLEIAGADFMYGPLRAPTYARLVADWGPRTGVPRLFLNHDPSAFGDVPDGAADLVLSGHTHGGHVGIQLTPTRALTVVGLLGLPDQGLFERADMRLFVTRCVGFYGYPMRVGIPPEIAVLTLRTPSASRTGDPTPRA
jgi:predicted MPP superfamily phosphohydrolase